MKITGHAGAKGLAPANTLAAFDKALKYHVDEIELDVRVTADHKVVLLHDAELSQADGTHLPVSQHTLAEIVAHNGDIIDLSTAVKHINHRVPIYIEIKRRVDPQPVIAVIKALLEQGWNSDEFRIGSYSQPILLATHQALPDITKIVVEDWSSIRAVRRAKAVNTKRISMLEYWLWPGFIRAMHERGYELYCFHSFSEKSRFKAWLYQKIRLTGQSNNPKQARHWAASGLTGVITDYPDLFDTSK